MADQLIAAPRDAAIELGDEIRALLDALTRTAVDPETLGRAREVVRAASDMLSGSVRGDGDPSPYDLPESCGRALSVGHGPANPIAPPLVYSWPGESVEGRFSLSSIYEGPPGHAHGGISAMVLDDAIARIPELLGRPRVTRGLTITYRRPVPLGVPLLVIGEPEAHDGAKIRVLGRIVREDAPQETLAEGDATFALLREDQIRRIAPAWTPGDRWPD